MIRINRRKIIGQVTQGISSNAILIWQKDPFIWTSKEIERDNTSCTSTVVCYEKFRYWFKLDLYFFIIEWTYEAKKWHPVPVR